MVRKRPAQTPVAAAFVRTITARSPCPAFPARRAAAATTIAPSRCPAYHVHRSAAATTTARNPARSTCRPAGRRGTHAGRPRARRASTLSGEQGDCGLRIADWPTPDAQLSPAAVFLDFWNTSAQHDSVFQKSPCLARPIGWRPVEQAPFARLVFQKPANLRPDMKLPKFPPMAWEGSSFFARRPKATNMLRNTRVFSKATGFRAERGGWK